LLVNPPELDERKEYNPEEETFPSDDEDDCGQGRSGKLTAVSQQTPPKSGLEIGTDILDI